VPCIKYVASRGGRGEGGLRMGFRFDRIFGSRQIQNNTKNTKNMKILCFEELDVLPGELEASFRAWKSFN
jgi:hypothetical protein